MVNMLEKHLQIPDEIKEAADFLTAYSSAVRYPTDVAEPDWSEVERAHALTISIRSFVLKNISAD